VSRSRDRNVKMSRAEAFPLGALCLVSIRARHCITDLDGNANCMCSAKNVPATGVSLRFWLSRHYCYQR
jgi:hypothetical protein